MNIKMVVPQVKTQYSFIGGYQCFTEKPAASLFKVYMMSELTIHCTALDI
jgi:hypothetical protein